MTPSQNLSLPVVAPLPTIAIDTDIADERLVSERCALTSWCDSCNKIRRGPQHESAETLLRHYTLDEQLGAGSFARVHLVHDKATGEKRCCKLVNTLSSRSAQPQEVFELTRREVQLLQELDHPHIVKLFEYAEDARRGELALILEYLPGGTCLDLLNGSNGCLNEALVTRLTLQLLLALGYCHARGVVHRDVKPDNMMLTEAKSWSFPDCKLIDFGLATWVNGPEEVLGTPSYIAPEVISKRTSHTFKSDMWSAGVTSAELLTGTNPFGKPQDFSGRDQPVIDQVLKFTSVNELENQGVIRWSSSCGHMPRNFIRWLLKADPAKRPSAAEAVASPWLKRDRPTPTSITSQILASLSCYPTAPPLATMCLQIVVARSAVPSYLGAAFLGADIDGDAMISYHDLREAVMKARKWWDPEVDVDALFSQSDAWSFTEFATACLYGQKSSLKELVKCAFAVLDDNRDGRVSLTTIKSCFPENELWRLQLPLGITDSFTLEQWLSSSIHCCSHEDNKGSPLERFFSKFSCASPNCIGIGGMSHKISGEQIVGRADEYAAYVKNEYTAWGAEWQPVA